MVLCNLLESVAENLLEFSSGEQKTDLKFGITFPILEMSYSILKKGLDLFKDDLMDEKGLKQL